MNNGINESVIAKIRRIKELADRAAGNENEAKVAAALMADLLAKHNISLATIEQASAKEQGRKVGFTPRTKTAHSGSAMYQFQRDLMKAIAELNFCVHWIEDKWKADPNGSKSRQFHAMSTCDGTNNRDMGRVAPAHIVLGSEENVIGTEIMYDYLTSTMDRLLPYTGMQKRGKEALGWLAGCADRLIERLTALKREREKEAEAYRESHPQEQGLVLVTDVQQMEADLNMDARYGRELGTTARRRQEEQAKYAIIANEEKRLMNGGMDVTIAWYVARGMTPPSEVEKSPEKPLTAKQKEAAERAQERDNQRFWDRQDRIRDKERAKKNRPEYKHGYSTAESVSLNQQVKGGSSERRLG